jgi:hypothetical protein
MLALSWLLHYWKVTSPTMRLYQTLYGASVSFGIWNIHSGVVAIFSEQPEINAVFHLCYGLAFVTPVLIVLVAGRDRLFLFMARRLDRDQGLQERDGAFISELLANANVDVGQLWWVLRSEKDAAFPSSDQRHHWEPGIVEEVTETEFIVGLKSTTATTRVSRTSRTSRTSTTSKISTAWPVDNARRVRLPLAGRTTLATDMLNIARQSLRCIDWVSITVELMASSTCAAPDRMLVRPLRPGERIDFFMSHSWHDDGRLKFQKLQGLATRLSPFRRPCNSWIAPPPIIFHVLHIFLFLEIEL